VAGDRPELVRKLAAALEMPGAPRPGEHLLVAVSGGPDSTALLVALVELASSRGLTVTAAHVDHGLRGMESADDAARVAELAGRVGVPFVSRAVALTPGSNLEARARRARYRALAAMAAAARATRIVTGHTQDDQVETLFLRLLRGSGRRGLGGMRPVRGPLFRPLLAVTRHDVRRFLAERSLPFAVDRTNADLRHARNRIRRLVVPFLRAEFNPRLDASLGALAERLRDEDDFLEAAATACAAVLTRDGALQIAVADEPRALARRIVRTWLERDARRGVGAFHVERVLRLAAGGRPGTVAVPGPARVVREGDLLVRRPGRAAAPAPLLRAIEPGESIVHPAGTWRLSLSRPRARQPDEGRTAGLRQALFDADVLVGRLAVRSPRAGDRIHLLQGGTRKLQDILVDAKVPREQRPTVPVLVADEEIIWVAGLARGRRAPVAPGTRRIIEAVLDAPETVC
jgi:tRNA(Ile)-lysidine synthase